MSKEPIKILTLEEMAPQKGQWYDYYGDIFISVVPLKNKPHIRRKASEIHNKNDSSTSQWHLEWQYEIIEAKYGVSAGGSKTYERQITVDGERHFIDSVINDKIAIEFQHSLGVSLEEIDSRYNAQKSVGYVPYLILDFTEFHSKELLGKSPRLLSRKLDKWLLSSYYKNDCLFLHCQNTLLRLSAKLEKEYSPLTKSNFVNQLEKLDTIFRKQLETERVERKAREKRAEIRAEERAEREDEYAREKNREDKFESKEFEQFRKCFRNPIIRPLIEHRGKELFNLRTYNEEKEGNVYEKHRVYSSADSNFTLTYITVSHYKVVPKHLYRRVVETREWEYWYAVVELSDEGEHLSFDIIDGKTRQAEY